MHPPSDHVSPARLIEYAASELSDVEASSVEDHLFECRECGMQANALEALFSAIRASVGGAGIRGIVTDDLLNRLARNGVRVRSFTLYPGARVPCAVWADDDLLAVRMRGDFRDGDELTLIQRVAGQETLRMAVPVTPSPYGELIHVIAAAGVRALPALDIEIELLGHRDGAEHRVASYTLAHEGSMQR